MEPLWETVKNSWRIGWIFTSGMSDVKGKIDEIRKKIKQEPGREQPAGLSFRAIARNLEAIRFLAIVWNERHQLI